MWQNSVSMTNARSQSLAMSSPQDASAPLEPENPDSIPSQECPISPKWIHAIMNPMGHPLTSDIGQRIQNWILSHGSSAKLSLITPTM